MKKTGKKLAAAVVAVMMSGMATACDNTPAVTPEDYFYPDNAITRGEAAIWMINGLGIEADAACPFPDVTDSAQKKAVGIAASC